MFRHLALTHGLELKKDLMKISIPLTQQDLANFTGLTRETVALELNKLVEMGMVSVEKKQYVINTKKVNDVITDEYNPGIFIQEKF
ncbi:MAG: hypothetical protein EOT05_04085 [Candidatus Microsaccharimonas sossegonensis]|uniref:HTH crp-type domain-containing protein n=1 Tax=Candidatus Microsaccharimonas sossegonensis TaxID=2506948 RepID=A0A4V1J7J4_9BACT|nr:MAG: hypothetical protein EOT05_04085 [Candidatus Microsaccharimonas sossegonensis]